MANENGYIVYPSGLPYTTLEHALDCARQESTEPPYYKARVEDIDTEALIARFQNGDRTV